MSIQWLNADMEELNVSIFKTRERLNKKRSPTFKS